MFSIDTDGRILGKHNIFVENRLVDACSTIDGHAVKQNRIDDLRPRVDTHVRALRRPTR